MTMKAIDESDSKFHYNSAVVTLLITSIIMLMITVVLITNLSSEYVKVLVVLMIIEITDRDTLIVNMR